MEHFPQSKQSLLARAEQLAGFSLQDIAEQLNLPFPSDLKREKGWVGQLLEKALGAQSGSLPQPDFPELGIELKTLPIDHMGKPLESTFVSSIPLLEVSRMTWQTSVVFKKLSCVLWIPVLASPQLTLAERRIGIPILWQPRADQMEILKQDWRELTDMIVFGHLDEITSHLGTYLQIRPKGANAKATVWARDASGEKFLTLPRGFYLRRSFTSQILKTAREAHKLSLACD